MSRQISFWFLQISLESASPSGVNEVMRPERLAHLIERHAAALELYARQWCAVPEDVVQEAYLKLVQQAVEPRNVAAWLYCVVRNGAISAGRSARRRQYHEAQSSLKSPWFISDESGRLDAAIVASAVDQLLVEEREVIIAHLWGGLTFEQIGEMTGTSAATAFRRYAAGLNELRTKLRISCPPTSVS